MRHVQIHLQDLVLVYSTERSCANIASYSLRSMLCSYRSSGEKNKVRASCMVIVLAPETTSPASAFCTKAPTTPHVNAWVQVKSGVFSGDDGVDQVREIWSSSTHVRIPSSKISASRTPLRS